MLIVTAVVPALFRVNAVAAADVIVLPVNVPEAAKVVNDPAAGVLPPIAGGFAKYDVNPAPEIVLDAFNVVNAPLLAVPEPIAPGAV